MEYSQRFFFCSLQLCIIISIISASFFWMVSAEEEPSIVVGYPLKLKLSSGWPVENSPSAKLGIICVRVYIRGLSRLKNLTKYAYSLKVKGTVEQTNSRIQPQIVEIRFHRNTSIGMGMCSQGEWEKLIKGSWVRSISPYENWFLDIRTHASSLEFIEISADEEFLYYRIIFLVLGIIMMTIASPVSESVTFYYSNAMAVGIILIILIVLFQGMKLLPTGRKKSLAFFIYGSIVGSGTILLGYLSGLLHSLLVEIGINEDIQNPLAMFLLVCIVIAGAWLGFWGVRKLVLCEDGSVDINIAWFVARSIRLVAAVMILLSSADTLLAAAALIFAILFTTAIRMVSKPRSFYHLFKHLFAPGAKYSRLVSNNPSVQDNPPYGRPTDSETYYSTFHTTSERRRFSKEDWEIFTRDTTRRALEGLVSSPDFTEWAAAHADRITLTPTKVETIKHRRRWFNLLFNGST